MKIHLLSLIGLLGWLFVLPVAPVRGFTTISCSTVAEEAEGNVQYRFDELGLACDEWDYTECEENCEKWVGNARITGVDDATLQAAVAGNPEVFEEFRGRILGGSGTLSTRLRDILSFSHSDEAVRELREFAARHTGLWANENWKYQATIGEPGSQTAEEEEDEELVGDACGEVGSNIGEGYAYGAEGFGYLADNRPVTLLMDINATNPPDDSYLSASTLILRITNFSQNDSGFRTAGNNIGNLLSGIDNQTNIVVVFGNELNNPEAEGYCTNVPEFGTEDQETVVAALGRCGSAYADDFAAFSGGLQNSGAQVRLAAAPLDLVNGEYPAEAFYSGASPAYQAANTTAANVYCPVDAVESCIAGSDLGLGFYPSGKPVVITEYGPLLDYGNLSQDGLTRQVNFIEETCGVPSQIAEVQAVTPLLKSSCGNAVGQWLYYKDGVVYDQSHTEFDPATCSGQTRDLSQICHDPSSTALDTVACGNWENWLLSMEQQLALQWERCSKEIIPAVEDEGYKNRNIYAQNPYPVKEGGETNYRVCLEFVDEYIGSREERPDDFNERVLYLHQNDPELLNSVLAIPETKVKARAFMVVVKDEDLNQEDCGFFCFIPTVNQALRVRPPQTIYVQDFFIEGIKGAAVGSERQAKHLMLPEWYEGIREDVLDNYEGSELVSYEPVCPSNCSIDQRACNNMENQDDVSADEAEFYKRLVNKICTETGGDNQAPSGFLELAGGTSPAKSSNETIIDWLFGLEIGDDGEVSQSEQPTVQAYIVQDRAVHHYNEWERYLRGLTWFPGNDRGNDLLLQQVQVNDNPAGTEQVSRTRMVPCTPDEPGCLPGGTRPEVESASVQYEVPEGELQFALEGAQGAETHRENSLRFTMPGWGGERLDCGEGMTLFDCYAQKTGNEGWLRGTLGL